VPPPYFQYGPDYTLLIALNARICGHRREKEGGDAESGEQGVLDDPVVRCRLCLWRGATRTSGGSGRRRQDVERKEDAGCRRKDCAASASCKRPV
jgi:hypothetical protein